MELVGEYLALGFLSKLILHSQIFPGYVMQASAISKTSALAKLKEKRAALKLRNAVVAA